MSKLMSYYRVMVVAWGLVWILPCILFYLLFMSFVFMVYRHLFHYPCCLVQTVGQNYKYSCFFTRKYKHKHNMKYYSCVSRMLRSNQISCIDNSTFTGLSSVRLLSLYDNRISSIAPGAFSTLHSLSTMWVTFITFMLFLLHFFHFCPISLTIFQCVSRSHLACLQIWLHHLPAFVSVSFFMSLPPLIFQSPARLWELSTVQHTQMHLHTCCSLDSVLLTDALHHYRWVWSGSQDICYQS